MKKLLLILALTTITSCTKEEIQPKTVKEEARTGLGIYEKYHGTWVRGTDTIKIEKDKVTINNTIIITEATWGARNPHSICFFLKNGGDLAFEDSVNNTWLSIFCTDINPNSFLFYRRL